MQSATTPSAATPSAVTLSEAESRRLLARCGVAVSPFVTARSAQEAVEAVCSDTGIAYPVAAKLSGRAIAHKTERGLVRLCIADEQALRTASDELLAAAAPADGDVELLVTAMVQGRRELIAGFVDDPSFGPTVMVGIGGILAEAVNDVAFRLAPLTEADAAEMIDALATRALLDELRGEPAVDRSELAAVLMALGRLAAEAPGVRSVDVNPLLVADGKPVAVDALVEIEQSAAALLDDLGGTRAGADAKADSIPPTAGELGGAQPEAAPDLAPLFEPEGVIVSGVSSHPGKFGFVTLHNLLASGYAGRVFAVGRGGGEVLGVPVLASVAEVPEHAADLVFMCTPAQANETVLEQAAAVGVRAAYCAAAGYAEAGEQGLAAQDRLLALARKLGIALAGPNGQGVVSTPARMCAQIVAPNPPPGRIAIASQSGNLMSSLMHLAGHYGVGVSRAVAAGNAAGLGIADYLAWFADDPETAVSIAYIESVPDGRSLFECLAALAQRKPVVVLKGGASEAGGRAAASHTGALAADDAVFDGMCRQAGVVRTADVEEAFEAAAAFATSPLPRGDRTVVVTTAGGWGVAAVDAMARTRLDPIELPHDLRRAIDAKLPPRWSRANPVDLAGGETRDTIPEVLELLASHPQVDAVVLLGIGVQSATASMMRSGGFYPDHGLDRIVGFHERQDARYAAAVAAVAEATGTPVLAASELTVTASDNPAPATLRAAEQMCYPSAGRAIRALSHLADHAAWRRAHGLPLR